MPNDSPYHHIYTSARWRKLRAAHLSTEPLCRYCTEQGRTELATVVDHITPIRDAPDRAFDMENLQSLCDPCHSSVKAREEQQGKRIGCDTNGIPLKGWE